MKPAKGHRAFFPNGRTAWVQSLDNIGRVTVRFRGGKIRRVAGWRFFPVGIGEWRVTFKRKSKIMRDHEQGTG